MSNALNGHAPVSEPVPSSIAPNSKRDRGRYTTWSVRNGVGTYESSRQFTKVEIGSKWLPRDGIVPSSGVAGGVEVLELDTKAGIRVKNISPSDGGQVCARWTKPASFLCRYALVEEGPVKEAEEPKQQPTKRDLTSREVELRNALEELGRQAWAASGMIGAQLPPNATRMAVEEIAVKGVAIMGEYSRFLMEWGAALSGG
jgi:hypothetical protein